MSALAFFVNAENPVVQIPALLDEIRRRYRKGTKVNTP
jgi:hypothetical protein